MIREAKQKQAKAPLSHVREKKLRFFLFIAAINMSEMDAVAAARMQMMQQAGRSPSPGRALKQPRFC